MECNKESIEKIYDLFFSGDFALASQLWKGYGYGKEEFMELIHSRMIVKNTPNWEDPYKFKWMDSEAFLEGKQFKDSKEKRAGWHGTSFKVNTLQQTDVFVKWTKWKGYLMSLRIELNCVAYPEQVPENLVNRALKFPFLILYVYRNVITMGVDNEILMQQCLPAMLVEDYVSDEYMELHYQHFKDGCDRIWKHFNETVISEIL